MADSEILKCLRDELHFELDRINDKLERHITFEINWAERFIRGDIKYLEKCLK